MACTTPSRTRPGSSSSWTSWLAARSAHALPATALPPPCHRLATADQPCSREDPGRWLGRALTERSRPGLPPPQEGRRDHHHLQAEALLRAAGPPSFSSLGSPPRSRGAPRVTPPCGAAGAADHSGGGAGAGAPPRPRYRLPRPQAGERHVRRGRYFESRSKCRHAHAPRPF